MAYKAICLLLFLHFIYCLPVCWFAIKPTLIKKSSDMVKGPYSIEATSYGRFYEKNNQTYISWFTSDLEQIKGNAITFEVIGEKLLLRSFG